MDKELEYANELARAYGYTIEHDDNGWQLCRDNLTCVTGLTLEEITEYLKNLQHE